MEMLKPLLRVQLAALIASFTGMKRQKKRKTAGKVALIALALIYCAFTFMMLFFTSFSTLAGAFFPLGIGWLYYVMLVIMAFGLMFVGSVFTAKAQLFEAKDNELLLSMPVPPRDILLSRMAALLLINVVLELVVAIPAALAAPIWRMPALGIVSFVLVLLALPLLALALTCLAAWLISLLTAKIRSKTLLTTILSVVFLGLYMVGVTRLNSYVNTLAQNGAQIAGKLSAVAPLLWVGRACAEGDALSLILALAVMIVPFLVMLWLLSRSLIRILTTKRGAAKIKYVRRELRTSSVDAALRGRELARITSSSAYILNAGLGLLFEIIGAVLLVVKRQAVRGFLETFGLDSDILLAIMTLLGLFLVGFVFFTSASVSIEGKSIWILQSMPVPPQRVLRAKQGISNRITILPTLCMTAAAIWVLQLSPLRAALFAACMLLGMLLSSNVGLTEDLRHGSLNWVNETQAVKQGMGVLFSMLLGWSFTLAVGLLYFLLLRKVMSTIAFLIALDVLMLLLVILTDRWLMTRGARRYQYMS